MTPSLSPPYSTITTGDGSVTFYSEEFGQAFHNQNGAREEALEKFVLPCRVLELARQQTEIHLLDVCFGLGYNSGVALESIWRVNPNCHVVLHALERSPEVPHQARQLGLWADWDFAFLWMEWLDVGRIEDERLTATIHWGDARQAIANIPAEFADVVFFDPFAPSACPELWTVDFFAGVVRAMKATGRLATYSCAAAVRTAMQMAGLHIGSTAPVGRPWPGTVASLSNQDLPLLSLAEREHLLTRAAVPYRDPTLQGSRADIRRDRQQEQQRSIFEPTSAWKRRWQTATATVSPEKTVFQ